MTLGKGIHTDRRWKLENACDLVCSGKFRVDDHCQPEFFL